jgi:DtxR family transcriptional regulator, Mn-dependent transcriptional regulator
MSDYPMAVEDYVKVIYAHTEWQPDPITPSVLAARLGLKPSSVTEMVKRLTGLGLVEHRPYSAVTLTPDGASLALRMVRRHRLIETWLVREHGYGWDEVHDEAEVLEHAISDRLLASIDARLGYPERDPHGDPIPSVGGDIRIPDALLLRDAADGSTVRIARINDHDPELLRFLGDNGIALDATLTVVGRSPYGGGFEVRGDDGSALSLGDLALASIWVVLAA